MDDDVQHAEGLHHPHSPVLESIEPRRRWTLWRIVLQILGFAVCVVLLVWAIRMALSPDNQESLDHLREAPLHLPIALTALTMGSVLANGLAFWLVLRPLRKLPVIEVIGVNAIATFLTGLPFKIGLLIRVLIHHRRDGIPFKIIITWFVAMAALGISVLGPLGVAGMWRGQLDVLWWVAAIGGLVVCQLGCLGAGALGGRNTFMRRALLGADEVLRRPSIVSGTLVIRLSDVVCLVGRFMVAGMIIDHHLTLDRAVLFASTYFIIGTVAPTGSLGVREAGVAGIGWFGSAAGDSVAPIAMLTLLVTAGEVIATLLMSIPAAIYLRLDRLFLASPSAHKKGPTEADP